MDGKTSGYKCALELPNSLVAHIVSHQGWGLKQAHDISSSQLAAFLVGPAGNSGHQFVTIRGINQQIGEVLVVFGKHIAKHCVCIPCKQYADNAALAVAMPAPS